MSLRIRSLRCEGCGIFRAGGGQCLGGHKDSDDLFGKGRRRPEIGDRQIHNVDRCERDGDVAIQVAYCHGRNTT